jgi:hypothetical protein
VIMRGARYYPGAHGVPKNASRLGPAELAASGWWQPFWDWSHPWKVGSFQAAMDFCQMHLSAYYSNHTSLLDTRTRWKLANPMTF